MTLEEAKKVAEIINRLDDGEHCLAARSIDDCLVSFPGFKWKLSHDDYPIILVTDGDK